MKSPTRYFKIVGNSSGCFYYYKLQEESLSNRIYMLTEESKWKMTYGTDVGLFIKDSQLWGNVTEITEEEMFMEML